jgi:hypothetical protein
MRDKEEKKAEGQGPSSLPAADKGPVVSLMYGENSDSCYKDASTIYQRYMKRNHYKNMGRERKEQRQLSGVASKASRTPEAKSLYTANKRGAIDISYVRPGLFLQDRAN